jgi:hypothetical protein
MHNSTYLRTVGRGLLTVVATLYLSGCALGSCGQEHVTPQQDGGGPDGDAGPTCSDPSCCMPDLPAYEATGGASVGVLGDPALDINAIGGPGATAMSGDYYLQNSCARFVIQKPGRIFSAIPEGGNIIDADIVRPTGEDGADEFGELTGFVNAMLYTKFDETAEVVISNDGSDGGPAVLEIHGGTIDIIEYMNIPALLYDSGGLSSAMDQAISTSQGWIDGVKVWVRYVLLPSECMVRVTWALYNGAASGTAKLGTTVGSFYQSAGEGQAFIPGFGYGPISPTEAFVTPRYHSKIFGNVGRKVAYAQRAYRYYNQDPITELDDSSQVTLSGLSLTLFGERAPLASLAPTSRQSEFVLKAQGCGAFEALVGVGRDLVAAQAAVTAFDTELGHVDGSVAPASALKDNVRVAVFQNYDPLDPNGTLTRKVLSSFTVQADGTYGGDLPPATYVLELDYPGFPRQYQKVTVVTGETSTVDPFDIPQTATITYNVTAGGAPTPCRISVIGQTGDKITGIRSNQYRDTLTDKYDYGLAYVEVSSVCDSSSTAPGAAGPLKVAPADFYRIVITHGPEYSRIDHVGVNGLATAGATYNVTGDLKKQVASDGWVSVDLHQHAYFSFDSRFPHERRLTAYLAEGMEFFGASEHDHVFDYGTLIDQMGYGSKLATMTGSEISPMHYGHFNAFELTPDYANPVNGGSPDWSGGAKHTVVAPDALLGMAQSAGADLISLNHPRAPDNITFFYWADRCGLFVAFGAPDMDHAVGCDPSLGTVPWDKLDVADGATLWTDKFDLIEIYNRPTPICRRATSNGVNGGCKETTAGTQYTPCVDPGTDPDGRIFDAQVDAIMQDWFNMLQAGFVRSIVGNSDSHKLAGEIVGVPRTYVFVGSGQDTPTNASLKNQVKAALKPDPTGTPARLAAAAVASNGPFVNVTVKGSKGGNATQAGIGGLMRHDQATVDVVIHVEAPDWMDVDRIEIFMNQESDIYQTAPDPSQRVNSGPLPGGIAPFVQTDASLVAAIPTGGWQTAGNVRSYDTTMTVPVPSGYDSWIVVRVTGSNNMYPNLPDFGCFNVTNGDDPALVAGPVFGTTASAITNPIFIDRDATAGWRGQEAP